MLPKDNITEHHSGQFQCKLSWRNYFILSYRIDIMSLVSNASGEIPGTTERTINPQ
jgi:hypothetical protein